jgi:hypothetical protein
VTKPGTGKGVLSFELAYTKFHPMIAPYRSNTREGLSMLEMGIGDLGWPSHKTRAAERHGAMVGEDSSNSQLDLIIKTSHGGQRRSLVGF